RAAGRGLDQAHAGLRRTAHPGARTLSHRGDVARAGRAGGRAGLRGLRHNAPGSCRSGTRSRARPGRAPGMRLAGALLILAALAGSGHAQEGMFLTEEQAPRAVFPDADRVTRSDVDSTPALRERISAHLSGGQPSLWEERYPVFAVSHGDTV